MDNNQTPFGTSPEQPGQAPAAPQAPSYGAYNTPGQPAQPAQPQQPNYAQQPQQPYGQPGQFNAPPKKPNAFMEAFNKSPVMEKAALGAAVLAALLAIIHFFYNPLNKMMGNIYSVLGGFGFSQWFSILPLVVGAAAVVMAIMARKAAAPNARLIANLAFAIGAAAFLVAVFQFFGNGVCICVNMNSLARSSYSF